MQIERMVGEMGKRWAEMLDDSMDEAITL